MSVIRTGCLVSIGLTISAFWIGGAVAKPEESRSACIQSRIGEAAVVETSENCGLCAVELQEAELDGADAEAGDRALLAELKQLRTEWQTEALFDEDQLTPPGLGNDSDLEEEHEEAYQRVVDQLFEMGLKENAAGGPGRQRTRELYEQALKWTAEDPRLPWLASLVVARQENPEQARKLLSTACGLLDRIPATLRLQQASLELELGDEESVWKTCREVVQQWPAAADEWPGNDARETQAVWLGEVLGYLAGGAQPSTFRLEEFRRILGRLWPEALVEDYDVALERMRDSRRVASRRVEATYERRQAEARESLQTLRDSIARSRTTEEQLRRKLANLESPYKEKWDQLILTLKQKQQRLTAAQAQARRLGVQLRKVSRANPTKANRNRRAQVRKQLKKGLEHVRNLQKQLTAGKAERKSLEARQAAQIHPVKHELNRIRLARQANEKEAERIAELLEAPRGTPPPPASFRQWRTVTEADLLQDLRAHWND
jgi:hypothetical protein